VRNRAITFFAVALLIGAFTTNVAASTRGQAPAARATAASDEGGRKPLCDENNPVCAETDQAIGYEGKYTGHDEPSVLFYSNTAGAGNSNLYRIRLPKDPPKLPTQDGSGGTDNFQLHPALWVGMALCDNQSGPEYTHASCTPNSDTNIFDGGDPAAADYIGKHPGTAFLEVQFYPPGYVTQPVGFSCDATKWCAAVAIFSLNLNQNTGVANNADCLSKVGIEPANYAFITKNGVATDPAGPMEINFIVRPDKVLFMNSGDSITLDVHDTAAGLHVGINDLSTGTTGFMTASTANGFAQIVYDPSATTCTELPYAFHPMYSTSSEHTRVPWAAHSYNVAFSDEIGHFEYCADASSFGGDCVEAGPNDPDGLDGDDSFCFDPEDSSRVKVGGCLATDNDFDGTSYQHTWPGSRSNPGSNTTLNPTSIQFSSPLFNGNQNYSRVAFEADLPRIEAADFGGSCNRTTGAGCSNPPPGADFYPIYTTRNTASGCVWQLGGALIPGTKQTFGGNSTAEYGPLLFSTYPATGNVPSIRTNNFRNVVSNNPCPAGS
jgi:hypothetical protein